MCYIFFKLATNLEKKYSWLFNYKIISFSITDNRKLLHEMTNKKNASQYHRPSIGICIVVGDWSFLRDNIVEYLILKYSTFLEKPCLLFRNLDDSLLPIKCFGRIDDQKNIIWKLDLQFPGFYITIYAGRNV